MNQKTKDMLNSGLILLLIACMFIAASYYTQVYSEEIQQLIGNSFTGMLTYVVLNIIEVIIAPISILPAIAIASSLWGWFLAAILTIIGWTVGSFIAFILARKYGIRLVKKFFNIKKIDKIEQRLPEENIFWSIVVLRIVIPADLLSYVLGLFSRIKKRDFILATAIGVTPLAFTLAYLGSLPLKYQIAGFILAGLIIILGLYIRSRRKRKE